MKIFLDSADIAEIKELNNLGIIDGITTNPSLIAKSSQNFITTISEICNIVKGDVSVEVIAETFTEILDEGRRIAGLAENIVIKLPMSFDSLRACRYFKQHNIKVNMTLCFSTHQALLAAKAGATYISPFIGRLEDIGENGIGLIEDIKKIYDNYSSSFNTQILAASIRSPEHIRKVSIIGVDVITTNADVIKELIKHDLTDKGLEKFKQDWSNSNLVI